MNRLLATSLACMTLTIGVAHAGEVTCGGRVKQINLHTDNAFMIQLDSMNYPVYFCNAKDTWTVPGTTHTTSPETCRSLIAMFLTAKAQDKALRSMYFDGAQVPASCNTWAPWSSANIRYFEWAE
jgi:hypothetical protein